MTDTTSEPQKKETEKKTHPKKSFSYLFITITLVIALIALFMTQQLKKNIAAQSKSISATLNTLVQQQSGTEARLQAYRAVTASREAREKAARLAFEKNISAQLKEKQHVSTDWQLKKAQYLLQLAAFNAHWGTDKATTLAMLTEADKILSALPLPDLITVRQALADDKQAIQNTPTLDTTAIMTTLSAARDQTQALPINPLPETKPASDSGSDKNKTHFLAHLVTIKHHSKPLSQKPTLAFESMLRESVRLNLDEAGWAVLEKNDALYQLALKQAIQLLEQSFVAHAASTKTLIQQLQTLQKTTLHTEKVVPQKALKALNLVISNPTSASAKPTEGDAS